MIKGRIGYGSNGSRGEFARANRGVDLLHEKRADVRPKGGGAGTEAETEDGAATGHVEPVHDGAGDVSFLQGERVGGDLAGGGEKARDDGTELVSRDELRVPRWEWAAGNAGVVSFRGGGAAGGRRGERGGRKGGDGRRRGGDGKRGEVVPGEVGGGGELGDGRGVGLVAGGRDLRGERATHAVVGGGNKGTEGRGERVVPPADGFREEGARVRVFRARGRESVVAERLPASGDDGVKPLTAVVFA